MVNLNLLLIETNIMKKKHLHQIKSSWYYVFWGAMAVAVVGGQIYVGLGYREMAEATKSTAISVTCVDGDQLGPVDKRNKPGEFE
jgi:Na+/H+ antiporter NhaC